MQSPPAAFSKHIPTETNLSRLYDVIGHKMKHYSSKVESGKAGVKRLAAEDPLAGTLVFFLCKKQLTEEDIRSIHTNMSYYIIGQSKDKSESLLAIHYRNSNQQSGSYILSSIQKLQGSADHVFQILDQRAMQKVLSLVRCATHVTDTMGLLSITLTSLQDSVRMLRTSFYDLQDKIAKAEFAHKIITKERDDFKKQAGEAQALNKDMQRLNYAMHSLNRGLEQKVGLLETETRDAKRQRLSPEVVTEVVADLIQSKNLVREKDVTPMANDIVLDLQLSSNECNIDSLDNLGALEDLNTLPHLTQADSFDDIENFNFDLDTDLDINFEEEAASWGSPTEPSSLMSPLAAFEAYLQQ